MVSPKQKAIDTVWSKYRVALRRLDKALDKLGQLPKQPVQATLRPMGRKQVEIPGFDDQPLPENQFIEDGELKDIKDLKPETIHHMFQEGQLPKEYDDLIRLEKKDGYIQSRAITNLGESNIKLHNPTALQGIYPGYEKVIGLTADSYESNSSFGIKFPSDPNKGDTFLRVDQLPTKLFKYNGIKWIELDKERSFSYSYNDEYIKYLANMIETGQYDTELLTEAEKMQVEELIKSGRLNDEE